MIPYLLRLALPEDHSFIYNTFLETFRKISPNQFISEEIYYSHQRERIRYLLKHSQTNIICDLDNPNHIQGYIIYDFISQYLVLHWMYLKNVYRRCDKSRQVLREIYPLLEKEPIICSHYSGSIFDHLKDQLQLTYNPFQHYGE